MPLVLSVDLHSLCCQKCDGRRTCREEVRMELVLGGSKATGRGTLGMGLGPEGKREEWARFVVA